MAVDVTMSVAEPESSVLKTPEWLEILENKRKRPHKLAHEVGAGAPCLVCKDGCKGLNLHFWRKLCIECKCRKEDHEVQEEEDYAQFEILFGAKKVKRTTLKFNAQNKSFDWIPPNVGPDLVIEYLKSIPESKLPISNSDGARYRKQQLEKQVPLHDVDPNACFNLSDNEMKEFEKYLNNLKDNVIGQGKILKYQSPKILKEDYIREVSPNVMLSSEEYKGVKVQGVEILGHLTVDKIPGYKFSSQSLQTDPHPADVKLFKHIQPVNLMTSNFQSLANSKNKSSHPPFKQEFNISAPKPFHPSILSQRGESTKTSSKDVPVDYQTNLNLKTPSSFINKSFPNDRQNNNAQPDGNYNVGFPNMKKIESLDERTKGEDNALMPGKTGFHQDPCDAAFDKDLFGKFNTLNISSENVPFAPVQEAENIFDQSRISKQDSVQHLHGNESSKKFEDISDEFPSPPSTCQQCLEILYPEEVVVQTEQGGNSALWHAKCFVCETCKELLVDLLYFFFKGKVYCGRHYAEIMKIPRCYGCDELIFVKEYTIAEGQSYHVRHFCCFHCDEPLGGKQYIPKDSFPVCLDCYQIKYGKNCQTCGLPIGAGEQRVSWKDLNFHVSHECFKCTRCKKSLLGGKFLVKNLNTFCSKECVQLFPE